MRTTVIGSSFWMAPETLDSRGHDTKVWNSMNKKEHWKISNLRYTVIRLDIWQTHVYYAHVHDDIITQQLIKI
jgi:hypothetical protein